MLSVKIAIVLSGIWLLKLLSIVFLVPAIPSELNVEVRFFPGSAIGLTIYGVTLVLENARICHRYRAGRLKPVVDFMYVLILTLVFVHRINY